MSRKTKIILGVFIIIIGLVMVGLSGCSDYRKPVNKNYISYPAFIHDVNHNRLLTMTVKRDKIRSKSHKYYFYGELSNHRRYHTQPHKMSDQQRNYIISTATVNHVDINSVWD